MTPGADAPRWRRYLRLTRTNIAGDVDDELAFHVDMRIERNISLGMSPDDARREALARFGDTALVRDALLDHDTRQHKAEGRREYISDFLQDIRFGWRSLRRAPGFAAAAVLTLALGIGANAAIFSVVDAVLLRPLPFVRPHELVSIGSGSGGEFVALRERLRGFSQLALFTPTTHNIDDGERAERIEGAFVSPNLFPTLGVAPLLGRGFQDEESILGNNTTIILGHRLWQSKFGGDPAVLGRRITLEGTRVTVVGVMPADFQFPDRATEYWLPFAFNPANPGVTWAVGGKQFIGRLAPGVTVEQASSELGDVWPTLRRLNPLWDPGESYRRDAAATPLQAQVVGSSADVLWVLFGSVVLVLLVGCVNVANLLLARATARERELSVRVALGGGRGRLVRQLVTESLLLAALGATIGLALAYASIEWLISVMPASIPRAQEIALSGSVLLFAIGLSVVTGLVFGIVPALRATRVTRNAAAVVGRRTTSGIQHHRVAGTLVVMEVALAALLAVGSILLVRSFWMLQSEETGYRAEQVVAARITPPNASFQDETRLAAMYAGIMDRLAARPEVEHVAAVNRLPFAQTVWDIAIRVQGQWEDGTSVLPELGSFQEVTPDYFATMGIPLLRGRAFTDADRADQMPVAIVSESVARRFWPQGDAIGQRIGYAWPSPWITVVGIVPDVKQDSVRDTSRTSMYVPWRQRTRMSGTELWVLARTTRNPENVAGAVRSVVEEVDRSVAVSEIKTMEGVVTDSMQRARFTMLLVSAFAGAALLLGAIGIYGVMAYLVGQRSREMGIRLALGARPTQVRALVLKRAATLATIGALLGVAAALVSTRWLGSLVYGISVTDPLTFAVVPVLFIAAAMLASYAPARRATQVDPARALSAE